MGMGNAPSAPMSAPGDAGDSNQGGDDVSLTERVARVDSDLSAIGQALEQEGSVPKDLIAGFAQLQKMYQQLLTAVNDGGKAPAGNSGQVDQMGGANGVPVGP